MKLEYANEKRNIITTIYVIIFIVFVVTLGAIGLYFEYKSISLVAVCIIVGLVLVILVPYRGKKNYERAIARKNGIMLNGVKVKGIAKKRASQLYVKYVDPNTKQEVGFETPILTQKAPRDVQWTCDVYILDNEQYATNFEQIST